MTEAGTVSPTRSLLRETAAPPLGAALFSVTVHDVLAPEVRLAATH